MIAKILALLAAYIIGSVLPAYWLGRFLRGIDIREYGSRNAGTVNAYHVLGLGPAVIAAFYDTLKGVAAMGIAFLVGAPTFFIYLSGIFAVIGHIFPFYLRFKGARGVAASTGLLLTYLTIIIINGWLSLTVLLFLGGYVLALYIIFRKGRILGILVPPVLYYVILWTSPSIYINIFSGIVILHILLINLLDIILRKPFRLEYETKKALFHVRVLMRPAAISFPILYLFLSRKTLLTLIGSVALFFLFIDFSRLISERLNLFVFRRLNFFFKEKERHTFSTATQFLTSIFLTILLFEKSIATMAIVFLTFGDIFAKFTGLQYGRIRLFGKTLEGTLAYFASSLIVGFIWAQFVPISPMLLVLGAMAAALTELLPMGVSDNFAIPLISAAVMRVALIF